MNNHNHQNYSDPIFPWKSLKTLTILPDWKRTYLNNNIGHLLKYISHAGANIHLFYSSDSDVLSFLLAYPNSKTLQSNNSRFPFLSICSLFIYLLRLKPDLVLWSYNGYSLNIALSVYRILSKRSILVLKADSCIPPKPKLSDSIYSHIRNLLLYILPYICCDLFLCESEGTLSKSETLFGNPAKLAMFRSGADLVAIDSFIANYHSLYSFSPRTILFTGRVSREKGLDLMISGFYNIVTTIPNDWRLAFVGPVDDQNYYHELLSLARMHGLSNRVIFDANADNHSLFHWYAQSSIFCLPSRSDGFSNSLIEAMAFSKPVIVSRVGYSSHIVHPENGITFELNNELELSQAFARLICDASERYRMGQQNRKLVEKDYNILTEIRNLENHLAPLLL